MSILSALGLSQRLGRPGGAPAPVPAKGRQKSEPTIGAIRHGRQENARVSYAEAFTPTQPKPGRRQFTGRVGELDRIMQALRHERAHVVLYSERGRGKTSLCNLVVQSLRQQGVIVARHTCDAESSFESIMRGLMRDLPAALLAAPGDDDRVDGCVSVLPASNIRPQDVVAILPRLTCRVLVCLVDEFDRVTDPLTRSRLADTIKQLSDNGAPLSFVVVGVSDDLDQILGQHPSIQRNLVAVHLPLMSDDEVGSILTDGGRLIGLEFPPPVMSRVVGLARGNPHMAQLLGLRLAQATARRNADVVADADISLVIRQAIAEVSPRDGRLYAGLTRDGADVEMATILQRLAEAPEDRWGCLRALREANGYVRIGSFGISLEAWEHLLAEGVLRPVDARSGLFTFQNRSFLHFLLLMAEQEREAEPSALPGDVRTLTAEFVGSARVHRLSPRL